MSITQDNLNLAQYIGVDPNSAEAGIPFQVAGAIKQKIEDNREDNNIDMEKNWDFYQGDHSYYFKQRHNEDDEVFKYRKQNIIAPNYCKFLINLSAKFAYGRNGKVRRQFIAEEDSNSKKTDDRLRRIDELVGYQEFMLEAKRNAGLFGEQPIRMIPLDERNGEPVSSVNDWTYPHPIRLDPRYTFCLINDWGKMQAVVIEESYIDYTNQSKEVEVLELIVQDSRWRWENGTLVSQEINTYNLDEEFVCFYNDGTRKDELQDILDLQIKLDEALTDQSHVYEKHGWPQLVTEIDLSQVTKAPGYIWEVSVDDSGKSMKDQMNFLTWDGKEIPARQYAKDLEAMIFKISSTAPISTGDLENIGNLRSGAALVTSYGPSIQKAQEKQVSWERNEINFFNAITKLDSSLHQTSVEVRFPGLLIDIRFPDDFVPGEELVRSEIDSMALNSHSISISDVIRRRHPEFRESQVSDYREEIIKDSADLTDSTNKVVTETKEPVSSGKQKSNEQPKQ